VKLGLQVRPATSFREYTNDEGEGLSGKGKEVVNNCWHWRD